MAKETTYIISHKNGTKRKITVPSDWKVTFGPAVKGTRRGNSPGSNLQMPMALRFYESETKQRAIFTDVVDFRDASIKILEEKVEVKEKDGFMECEGVRKRTTFQATVKSWIDPDKEPEQKPLLPSDAEMFEEED